MNKLRRSTRRLGKALSMAFEEHDLAEHIGEAMDNVEDAQLHALDQRLIETQARVVTLDTNLQRLYKLLYASSQVQAEINLTRLIALVK